MQLANVIALVCAMSGCHKDDAPAGDNPFAWGPRHADSLQVGPYKIAIPATWRDLSESIAKDAPKLPPGAVGMTPEGAAQGAYRTNIILIWATNPPGSTTDCQTYANTIAAAEGNATVSHLKAQTYSQGPGCSWDFDATDGAGLHALRFEHDHVLSVSCTKMKSLGTGIDPECLHVLSELNLQRSP